MSANNPIFKGDDIGSFGGKITVNFDNPKGYTITRAEFQCGCFYQNINNPVFPLEFKPTREQNEKFSSANVCYLRVYDENGLRKTCTGTMTLYAQNGVIKENGICS